MAEYLVKFSKRAAVGARSTIDDYACVRGIYKHRLCWETCTNSVRVALNYLHIIIHIQLYLRKRTYLATLPAMVPALKDAKRSIALALNRCVIGAPCAVLIIQWILVRVSVSRRNVRRR